MYNDRPSSRRIALTLAGWVLGLLVFFAAVFALASALNPRVPDVAPTASTDSTAASAPATPPGGALPPASGVVPTLATAPSVLKVPAPAAPPATPAPAPSSSALAGSESLAGKVVVIDAGHQAKGDSSLEPIGPGSTTRKAKVTTGASGVVTHQPESLINLQVALKLAAQLRERGAKVVMVRTRQDVNISNSKRAAIANEANAHLFIRLHCDSSTDHAQSGLSTLVPSSNKWTRPIVTKSRAAGRAVQLAVIGQTGAVDRGVVSRGDLSGFNWSKVPTILVEMGFLSNQTEDQKLATDQYQTRLSSGLANGIANYLRSN